MMGLKVGQTENESLFSDSPRYATLRLTTCHKNIFRRLCRHVGILHVFFIRTSTLKEALLWS